MLRCVLDFNCYNWKLKENICRSHVQIQSYTLLCTMYTYAHLQACVCVSHQYNRIPHYTTHVNVYRTELNSTTTEFLFVFHFFFFSSLISREEYDHCGNVEVDNPTETNTNTNLKMHMYGNISECLYWANNMTFILHRVR